MDDWSYSAIYNVMNFADKGSFSASLFWLLVLVFVVALAIEIYERMNCLERSMLPAVFVFPFILVWEFLKKFFGMG
jgi:hypothetical protein